MSKTSLLHAPDYSILTSKIEKSPYPGRGDTPLPDASQPSRGSFAASGSGYVVLYVINFNPDSD